MSVWAMLSAAEVYLLTARKKEKALPDPVVRMMEGKNQVLRVS